MEIGFGLGYSADVIQKYDINTHTIIECNPEVLKKLRNGYHNINSLIKNLIFIILDLFLKEMIISNVLVNYFKIIMLLNKYNLR